MNIFQWTEKINLRRAKILSKIDSNLLEDEGMDKITIKKIKNYCDRIIFLGGEEKLKSHYSESLVKYGRQYANHYSIQNFWDKLRGYLCGEYYNDMDMVNAASSILNYILLKYFPNENFDYLQFYIDNREQVLETIDSDRYKAKLKINVMMFSNKLQTDLKSEFIEKLNLDFLKAQNLIFDNEFELNKELQHLKNISKKNKEGSFLSHVIFNLENKILTEARNNFEEVSTPIFDGFHLPKNINVDYALKILNDNEYGIKWKNKKFNDDLSKFDNLYTDEELDIDELADYETTKKNFEENYFMILNPVIFGMEYTFKGERTYALYKKSDFISLVDHFQYIEEKVGKTGRRTIIKKSFFPEWLKDRKRRQYKSLDFYPIHDKIISPEYFNTFKGFKMNNDSYDYTIGEQEEKDLESFLNHLKFLSDNDEKSYLYLLNYFSQLIQQTHILPKVILLWKSPQGFGKGIIKQFFEEMMGFKYVWICPKIEQLLGKHNEDLADKILIFIDELEGKKGFEFKEELKNIAVEPTISINPKGLKPYDISNFTRFIILSNNSNPVSIPPDDRRFVVIQSRQPKPTRHYFNNLGRILKNKSSMYHIFNYFKNFNITLDLANDRPITDAYDCMKNSQQNPIYSYLDELFSRDLIDDYLEKEDDDYLIHMKSDNIFIKSSIFYHSFKSYLEKYNLQHIKPSYSGVKMSLFNLGVERKSKRIKGNVGDYYIFDKKLLESKLSSMNIKSLIEDMEDDEFK